MKKLFVVLHHTGDPSRGPQFLTVNASHRRRGFPLSRLGFFVGYHYFIGVDGTVRQARGEEEVGAHCPAKMMNHVGIGICLAGDFTRQNPDPRQIDALTQLVSDIQHRWPIPDEAILLHRECKPTACPGKDLRALLLAARAESVTPKPGVLAHVQSRVAARLARRIRR